MLIKKFDKRFSGDKVVLSKKFCPRELILMDITTDCSNILMQNFGNLLDGIESEFDAHFIPSLSSIFSSLSSCFLTNLGIVLFLFRSSAHQRSWHFLGARQNLCQERVFFNLAPHQSHFTLLEVYSIINQLYAYKCMSMRFWVKKGHYH